MDTTMRTSRDMSPASSWMEGEIRDVMERSVNAVKDLTGAVPGRMRKNYGMFDLNNLENT